MRANGRKIARKEKCCTLRHGEIACSKCMSVRERIAARLHAESIACERECAIVMIEQREREHAAEFAQRRWHTKRTDRSKHRFGV